jgi:hypothetical protein
MVESSSVEELVHADLAPLRQLAKALVLLVGQTDRQGGHARSPSEVSGRQDSQSGELELYALEVADVLRDDDRGAPAAASSIR